jgi:hypothetical protein
MGPAGSWKPRECVSALQVLFKTYDNVWEEGARRFLSNNHWVGRGMGGSWPGEGGS